MKNNDDKHRDLDAWWGAGDRLRLALPGQSVASEIFYRCEGDGPCLTLLHGFPASSYDWRTVWEDLVSRYRVLALDFLGYGASDKPIETPYSTALNADTVQALWLKLGVRETYLVGHDIGTAVTQELLARDIDQSMPTRLAGVMLMNGAVFIDNYRPTPLQRAILNPLSGRLIGALMTKDRFVKGLRASLADPAALDDVQSDAYWRAMSRAGGERQLHRMLHHIPERVRHRTRWEGALTHTQRPVHFLWGTRDPFVGAISNDIRRRMPSARLLELSESGHFPHIEAPDVFVAEVKARFDRDTSPPSP